jgi:hypothetical protein
MKGGPNFAGELALVEIGCGTSCRFVGVANVRTGQLGSFPLGGEDNYALNLKYEVSSNLVIAHWQRGERCIQQSFAWTGVYFRQVDVAEIGNRDACEKSSGASAFR